MSLLLKIILKYYLAIICVLNVSCQLLEFDESLEDPIQFYVYTRQQNEIPQRLNTDVESIVRNVLNPTKPTTFAIHGAQGNKTSKECLIIKDSKLNVEDANVIVVDYSYLNNRKDIKDVSITVVLASKAIAELISLLHDNFNMNLKDIHIVGFSLGGQIAGFVGQEIYESYGEKLNRITALDPAGQQFTETTPANEKLTPGDADYVEVIHTNAGIYGYRMPCGHVDYYVNGGKLQPGCSVTDNVCSHNRAYHFIPEMWSPIKNFEFLLLKCENLEFMGLDSCRWQNKRMGSLEQQLNGLYYVETNSNIPFGKGAFKTQFL